MTAARFELLLFTARPDLAAAALSAGIDGVVVDLEYRGKGVRQEGADTEVNRFSPADVAAVRAASSGHLICRINAVGAWTAAEVEAVLDAGADELLVPMVRTPAQVESVQALVAGRARVGALVETPEAVEAASAIAGLELSRIYLGLNDLAIARRTPNLFTALVDGTAQRVAEQVAPTGTSFGLAGLTLPDRGDPIACSLLMGEMHRLGCTHGFMRRSFLRDVPPSRFAEGVASIRAGLEAAAHRIPAEVAADRERLVSVVEAWNVPATSERESAPGRGPGPAPLAETEPANA